MVWPFCMGVSTAPEANYSSKAGRWSDCSIEGGSEEDTHSGYLHTVNQMPNKSVKLPPCKPRRRRRKEGSPERSQLEAERVRVGEERGFA